MFEAGMDAPLDYGKYERTEENNYRNGTKPKRVRSKYGEFEVNVPQDRQSFFEPQIIPKRKKDILRGYFKWKPRRCKEAFQTLLMMSVII